MVIKNNIKIKNFGPIKKANIDIAPLTIFIGPNSSGKSYLSLLIHSILNSYNNLGLNFYNKIRYDCVNKFLENDSESFKEFKDSLNEYINSKPKLSDDPFKFPAEKFKIILEDSFGQVLNNIIEEKLKGNFSNNLNRLNQFQKFPFEFSFNNNSFINEDGNLKLNKFYIDLNNVKNEGLSSENDNIASFEINEDIVSIKLNYILWHDFFDKDEYFIETIFMMIVSSVMDLFDHTSHYLSAIGDEIFKDINFFISKGINDDLDFSNIQKELLTNFLKVREDMEHGPFYNLAIGLEHELLGGELQFKKGEIKEELLFVDEEYGIEFELGLTSSFIRELTPLIIYLKYFLQKGNTLIIEEPENHLHPENQRILVKYLVKLINNDLNIILTTHSDYILEQFNNLIRLGKVNKDKLNELGYSDENILNHEEVKIYNFKKESDYLYVPKEVDINETGFIDENFSEVTDELYNESVNIIDNMESD